MFAVIWARSIRDKQIIVVNGYSFTRSKFRGAKTEWHCSRHNVCKARVVTISDTRHLVQANLEIYITQRTAMIPFHTKYEMKYTINYIYFLF